MVANLIKKYFVVGEDTPLLQAFCEAIRAAGCEVVWAGPENLELSKNAEIWIFDIADNAISANVWNAVQKLQAAAIFYLYKPGRKAALQNGSGLQVHYIQQPHFVIDQQSGALHSSGLAEHLLSIKEEAASRIPAFWEHNPYPLASHSCTQIVTAAFLHEIIDMPRKQATVFIPASRFTLQHLCQQMTGLSVEPFDGEPANPLASLINEVVQAFSDSLPAAETHTAVTLDDILPLLTAQQRDGAAAENVFEYMTEKTLEDKAIRYFVGGSGHNVIVIINALGLTIKFWQQALQLLQCRYTVVVWETRCCELFTGGMKQVVTIDDHVNDLLAIIRQEQWTGCHLVSWCNGGRIAVAAAAREPSLTASLIFLSPVFKGIEGLLADDTRFEKELDEVFREVSKNPKIAGLFAEYLVRSNSKAEDPALAVKNLLGLTDEPFKKEVIAPMRTGDYLINYAGRTFIDEQYLLKDPIDSIHQPVMFILGTDDAVISNKLTMQVSKLFKDVRVFMVAGASHYIQLQQPRIFARLVTAFLEKQHYKGDGVRVKQLATT